MKLQNYKELTVWKKSIVVCKNIYDVTKLFPKEEQYGITSQMRRSAVSIPSNIAEGYRRASTKEYLHFLRISLGSASELETQLIIAYEIDYIKQKDLNALSFQVEEVTKMLYSLIKSLHTEH